MALINIYTKAEYMYISKDVTKLEISFEILFP